MTKQTFRIAVEWTMEGVFEIEAHSLNDAIEEAYERMDFPEKQEYVDSSFRVKSGLQNTKEESQ